MDLHLTEQLQKNTDAVTRRVQERYGDLLSRTHFDSVTDTQAYERVSDAPMCLMLDAALTGLGRHGVSASLHSPTFNGISHRHGFFEVQYVLSGSVIEEEADGRRIVLEAGAAILHNPAAMHTVVKYDPTEDLAINLLVSREVFSQSFYSIVIRDSRLSSFFTRTLSDEESYMAFHKTKPGVLHALEHLLTELFCPDISDAVLGSSLLLFFAELLRSYKSSEDRDDGALSRFIAENLATVTLNGCAEHFGYHPKYLSALIKRREGTSFSHLVQGMRLRAAESHLLFSDDSIEAIAERVGYRDPCSLYELFRKEHGVSPAVWRKRREKN